MSRITSGARAIGIAVCIVLLAACATKPTTTAREHPDIDTALLDVERVVVAPAIVSIERIVFSGENERLTAQEARIAAELEAATAVALGARGYEVVPFDFNAAREADADLAFALNQVTEAFNRVKGDMQLGRAIPEEKKRQFAESLGEAVNQVADAADADAVVIVQFGGFDKSGGQQAKEMASSILLGVLLGSTAIQPSEGSYVEVALVDGVTGNLLWADAAGAAKLGSELVVRALASVPADIDPTDPASDVVVPDDGQPASAPETLAVEEAPNPSA